MSCHYQPLIVPSQHFPIYIDFLVPSSRYAWLTKQAQLDVVFFDFLYAIISRFFFLESWLRNLEDWTVYWLVIRIPQCTHLTL